jgi:predicted DNA binding CopG/RHH family protein
MSKKIKVPTLKEIEDNFSDWVDVPPERLEIVKKRNDHLREELKESKINMRIKGGDLSLLMEKAAEKGMGYQTLLSSLIHLYVNDQLVDVSEVRKVMGFSQKAARATASKKRK